MCKMTNSVATVSYSFKYTVNTSDAKREEEILYCEGAEARAAQRSCGTGVSMARLDRA